MIIENGAGDGGFSAKVDSFKRLLVRSFSSTQASHGVLIGQGFAATVDNTLGAIAVPTAFDGTIFMIENTDSSKPLLIDKINIQASVAGVFISYIQQPTKASTTNKTAMIPVNMKFGSNASADAIIEFWDEVSTGIGGLSGGNKFQTIRLDTSSFTDRVAGFIRLDPGNILTLQADNDTGSTSNIAINVRFFYEG